MKRILNFYQLASYPTDTFSQENDNNNFVYSYNELGGRLSRPIASQCWPDLSTCKLYTYAQNVAAITQTCNCPTYCVLGWT